MGTCPGAGIRIHTQFLISRLTHCGWNHRSQEQGGFFKMWFKRQASALFWHKLAASMFPPALNICSTSGNVSITATEQTLALGTAGTAARRFTCYSEQPDLGNTLTLRHKPRWGFCSLKKTLSPGPDRQGSVGRVSSRKARGCQFDSWLGHMPGLRASSPGGGIREADDQCLSLLLSPFPCLKIKKIKKILF